MKQFPSRCQIGVAVVAALALITSLVALAGGTDDLALHAKLVWGANSEKPRDPKVQPVDAETAKKLSKVFKWQSYYEVSRTNFTVSAGSKQKVPMSSKCEIEVEYIGSSNI